MLDALNWGQPRALQCPCSQSQPRRGQSCSAPPRPQQLLLLLHQSAATPAGWDTVLGMLHQLSSPHLEGAVEKGSSGGGPKAQTLTSTASPTPLCYPQLWEAARAQCDPSPGSPEIPIWISGQCWATFPSSSSTAPVRPALRNQSSSTFFLERAAQGHRAASPCWLGKRVWKGNLRHLKH